MKVGFLLGGTVLLVSAAAFGQALQFKGGEALVKLKARRGVVGYGVQAHELLLSLGKHYAVSLQPLLTDKSLYTVKARGQVDLPALISEISANGAVQYAEPNFIYHTFDIADDPVKSVLPNDPSFNLNWGLFNTGQKDAKGQDGTVGSDIGATRAWASGTGSKDIVVAVIDTGIDFSHPDLKNNIYVNPKEDPSNGQDNDHNGFINDWHGWNFADKNNNPQDDNKHGTHTSGTIGAEGGNGIGTVGVNWHVSILPIKFLTAAGSGSLEDAVESINYATLMGAKIMSNSWGGGGFSQAMLDAIKNAKEKGVLFVAAAGNDGSDNDARKSYPASYDVDNIISVAATDNRDKKASWSNYGKKTVHLSAPGVNIYSTLPVDKESYGTLSGTSMATPHVSGAAALLWSLYRKMSYSDIKARLLATVDPVRTLRRRTITGGRLDIYNAINNIVVPWQDPPENMWKAMAQSIESAHPYLNSSNVTFEVSHPGARFIRLHFSKIETEPSYDVIKITSSKGDLIEELSGKLSDFTTDYIDGDQAIVTFTSDTSVTGWGYAIDRYDFID